MEIKIQKLSEGEEKAASETEKACLPTAWSEQQIKETLGNGNALYFTARADGEICGIISAYCVCSEAEIINFAVLPEMRNKGVGTALIFKLLEELRKRSAEAVTLEVACSNENAQALYIKNGFIKKGVRKNFYRSEDAFVMEKIL